MWIILCTPFIPSEGAVTRGSYEVSVLTREQFFADESYEGLFSEWAAEQTNYLIKDRAFLHWRTRAPGAGYQFVKLSLGGQWAGLAITRATDLSGVPTLAVLDLMVPSKHRAGLSRLHQGLFELASRERAELIATMMSPSSAGRNRLVQNLFIRTPAVFSIIFKVLNPELNRGTFSREQDWSLTWLDSDNL